MKNDNQHDLAVKAFYEQKYRSGQEYQRTSKLYTLGCIPKTGTLKVLDIGCGTGINSQVISSLGHDVIGVDISEEAIRKYHSRGFSGHVMDIEKPLEFPDEEFDLVFCSEVIEHLINVKGLIREIYRILRSNGRIIASTPNSFFWLYRVAAIFGYPVSELQHPKHVQFFSQRSLSALVTEGGFSLILETGRNMYMILPNPKLSMLKHLFSFIGFKEEKRFRTNSSFWHLSNQSCFFNRIFADTLILVAQKL